MTDQAPQQKASTIAAVTEDELLIAHEGAAVFSNKFYITATGPIARIAFTEVPPQSKKPIFRTAVLLSVADLIKLAEVIKHVTASVQEVRVEQAPKKPNG